MLFGPWQISFLLALALTAGAIVVLIRVLFNRLGFDVGVCPRVKLMPIKANALFPNGEFADVGADGVLEFFPAHAEVSWGVHRPDEARRGL
ncbi:hypothetical protein GIW54_06890 [Pseudomonas proteolytica]|uniref:Uncharacterized protein n=1 Tax=Pseudomonas proteolytica TaxID=219574 RepID=A0AAW4ZXV8_9PSED|nr:hypothetical protein [Pseudomonas proteolytica]MCF5100489.1 hypothetical protein [Pseudomonas proteolytica]